MSTTLRMLPLLFAVAIAMPTWPGAVDDHSANNQPQELGDSHSMSMHQGGKGTMSMGGKGSQYQVEGDYTKDPKAAIAKLQAARPCQTECISGCDSRKDAEKPQCKACAECMEKADKPGIPIKMAIAQVKQYASGNGGKGKLGESAQSKIAAASDKIDEMNAGSAHAFDKMLTKMSPEDRKRAQNDELFNMVRGQMEGQVDEMKTAGLNRAQKQELFDQRLARNMGFEEDKVQKSGYQMPTGGYGPN